jgi:dTDP-4-amino-4,6-dideoxygalactose transaminase
LCVALGARDADFAVGELGDGVATSFIIQKNLGCFGDGGALITNDRELAMRIWKLRNHHALKRSCHSIGYNSRFDEIHPAMLSVKLKQLD